ncbi:hypothetical protein RGQ13_05550 [Thalassotalea psychrophila]|uniref:Carrier domain-containing protein n=1 Tax=Thalassotalea psychrophila TaxID=3065647 RepID=A0ABY9TY39_9GAMM|nr:hypothetical protein RGQ13_05550 [Colwelliaceae bacterium SQ149]
MVDEKQFFSDMANILACPAEQINAKTKMLDLVDNSFTLVELIIEMQELYGISFGQIELKTVENVGQLQELFNID